jgi:hypothetical protein
MAEKQGKIVFVYNAESGIFNAVADYAHKTLSPDTYECNLCQLTYGMTMNKEWKQFIAELPYEVAFLHRDEFYEAYDRDDTAFPAAYFQTDEELSLFISQDDINQQKTLKDLIELVKNKVASL